MSLRSIDMPGASHNAPIPAAARVGQILCSSAISGKDAATGQLSPDPVEQTRHAFANLKATAATLGVLLAILVGIAWIMEGVVGLTMIGDARSKIWTIVYALVSVVAGIVMLSSPLWGATVLWMLMGLSLLVLGLIQAVRAFRFGSK